MSTLMLTVFGATAVTFMMLMYALERRHEGFVLAFALGCALSSAYGFLAGAWPFGVVEAIWALVAARRYFDRDLEPSTDVRRPQTAAAPAQLAGARAEGHRAISSQMTVLTYSAAAVGTPLAAPLPRRATRLRGTRSGTPRPSCTRNPRWCSSSL